MFNKPEEKWKEKGNRKCASCSSVIKSFLIRIRVFDEESIINVTCLLCENELNDRNKLAEISVKEISFMRNVVLLIIFVLIIQIKLPLCEE